jgi:hypothetical protein
MEIFDPEQGKAKLLLVSHFMQKVRTIFKLKFVLQAGAFGILKCIQKNTYFLLATPFANIMFPLSRLHQDKCNQFKVKFISNNYNSHSFVSCKLNLG